MELLFLPFYSGNEIWSSLYFLASLLMTSCRVNSERTLGEPAVHAIAGALGGSIALFITYPMSLLSMRMQLCRSGGSSTIAEMHVRPHPKDCRNSKNIPFLWKKLVHLLERILNAIQQWYSGITSAILAQLIIQYTYYYAYSYSKILLRRYSDDATLITDFICSTLSGMLGATVSQPFWVLNTKKAIDSSQTGTFRSMLRIIEQSGVRSLFQGLLPSYMLVLNPVVAYTVYEAFKRSALAARGMTVDQSRAKLTGIEVFFFSAIGKIAATLLTYPYLVARNVMQYGAYEKSSTSVSKSTKAQDNDTSDRCDRRLSFELEKGPSSSVLGVWRHIIAKDGYCALYRGLESKIVQSVMNHSLLFLFQDKLSTYLTKRMSA